MTSLEPKFAVLDSIQDDATPSLSSLRPENDQIRQAWALALAQTLTAQLPPNLRLGSAEPATNAWQQSDAGLTALGQRQESDASRSVSRVPDGTSSDSKDSIQRITAEVDGGQLGRVKFSVDRSPAGLTIVIGAADPYALRVLDLERTILLQSLRAGGLQVASVSVAKLDQVGTSLAPARSNVRESASKIRAYKSHLRDDPEETDEGLDLIG